MSFNIIASHDNVVKFLGRVERDNKQEVMDADFETKRNFNMDGISIFTSHHSLFLRRVTGGRLLYETPNIDLDINLALASSCAKHLPSLSRVEPSLQELSTLERKWRSLLDPAGKQQGCDDIKPRSVDI